MDKKYQMVTVYQYLELLEGNSAKDGKNLKKVMTQYLMSTNKANKNAVILEQMLA